MSSIKNIVFNKSTIVLFQGGLGDGGDGFIETLNKLEASSNSVVKISEVIDMKNFDIIKGNFYGYNKQGYFKVDNDSLTEFSTLIANVVSKLNVNDNKAILVRTSLDKNIVGYNNVSKDNKYLSFDSIKNQSKKLVYIINEIKRLSPSADIILVGHSQGGLVNLETACEIPYNISRLISISTPYSEVSIAKEVMAIDTLASMFGKNIYNEIQKDVDLAVRYKERVETLGNKAYFDELKSKWNKLTNRPILDVIAGVSGLLLDRVPTLDYSIAVYKKPFDGVVRINEQLNVDFANKHTLVNKNIPCFNDKFYNRSLCYQWDKFNYGCGKKCNMPVLELTPNIIEIGLDVAWKWITNKMDTLDIMSYPQVVEIFNGINHKTLGKTCTNEKYRDYFNIYADEFSHQNIRYCKETLGIILNIIL